jgi:importin-9
MFEFIQIASKRKQFRHMFQGDTGPTIFLKELVDVMLTYMQLPTSTEVLWAQDLNQFIQDDEEEAMTFNVRIAVEQCLLSILEVYSSDFLAVLSMSCVAKFHQGNQLRANGVQSWF